MMEGKHIDVFVDGLKHYFDHLDITTTGSKGTLDISAPYLINSQQKLGLDYTGMISVTGNRTGYIFFSAKSSLLRFILLSYGESDFSERFKSDLVGEVANTLAGNARKYLGSDFHISTPTILANGIDASNYKLSKRCFVLPFRWRSNKAELIVSI